MSTVIVTSGPCKEPIDNVRSIVNTSSGKLGAKIAEAFLTKDINRLIYVHGPGAKMPPGDERVEKISIQTARDLSRVVQEVMSAEKVDYFVHSMAVSDYYVEGVYDTQNTHLLMHKQEAKNLLSNKINSNNDELYIRLQKNPKILDMIKPLQPEVTLVGFKLLDGVSEDELLDVAYKQLLRADCDLVLANDLTQIRSGQQHTGFLVYSDGTSTRLSGKNQIALELVHKAFELRER